MLKIEDAHLELALSGEEINGSVPQGVLSDLYEVRRLRAVLKERESTLCASIRDVFLRRITKTRSGERRTSFVLPEGMLVEGSFNVKLAANASRDFQYKQRLVDAYTEIELRTSGVRRTKKAIAEARIKAKARMEKENDSVVPSEGTPKVLVTHKED